MLGVVKKWSDSKGFGFISSDLGEVFVHYTYISDELKTLKIGDLVSFEEKAYFLGYEAMNVKTCKQQ